MPSTNIICLMTCMVPLATVAMNAAQMPEVRSASEQCQAVGFRGLCMETDHLACSYMICAMTGAFGFIKPVIYRPADEGTICGKSKICREKQCVDWDPKDPRFETITFGYYNCHVESL